MPIPKLNYYLSSPHERIDRIDLGESRRRADRGGWKTGETGPCITSTPKSAEKAKKWQKRAKYERRSCMPWPKNGERPYLAVPEPTFWGLFFSLFWPLFSIFLPSNPSPVASKQCHPILFYIYILTPKHLLCHTHNHHFNPPFITNIHAQRC